VRQVDARALGQLHRLLEVERAAALDDLAVVAAELVRIGREDIRVGMADGRLARQAGQALERAVDVQERAVEILDEHRDRRVVDDLPELHRVAALVAGHVEREELGGGLVEHRRSSVGG
jgi:hypothetical protein